MKKMLFASILLALFASSAVMAQLAVAPEGAVIPNGALHYVVRAACPFAYILCRMICDFLLPRFTRCPTPWFPVPIPPPGGSTSDRIKPQDYSEPRPVRLLRLMEKPLVNRIPSLLQEECRTKRPVRGSSPALESMTNGNRSPKRT